MCYCVEAYVWNPDLRLYEFPFKSETTKRVFHKQNPGSNNSRPNLQMKFILRAGDLFQ